MSFSFKAIGNAIVKKASTAAFKMKVHSPALLVGAGIVGLVTAGVLACKATPKAVKVTEKCKEDIEKVKEDLTNNAPDKNGKPYTVEKAKHDTRTIYFHTAGKYVKTYGIPVALGVLSIGSILMGFKILNGRYVATAGLLAATERKFDSYRDRVRGRLGTEEEDLLYRNARKEIVKEITVDEETGEVKEELKEKIVQSRSDIDLNDKFLFIYDAANALDWKRYPGWNLKYLRDAEQELNRRLQSRGYLTLNQALEAIGLQPVDYGMIAGWIASDPGAHVSFGITDEAGNCEGDPNADLACWSGGSPDYLLHINCRGNIQKDMPGRGERRGWGQTRITPLPETVRPRVQFT